MSQGKRHISDLALFGGTLSFPVPRSIGSLAKPDPDVFLRYSRVFYDRHQYSNNGPVNRLLEQRLAAFHETERCVSFASAFWGLSLAIRHLALPGRSEVVMPSLTYRRMGEIVASAGMIPRFCDVDPDTLAQTATTTRPCINDDTALILGAHPTVNCCDAEGLENLSTETGIPILFDSVESTYETVNGRRVGTFGRAEGFSIHATKLINGFEGGYLVTNDHDLADRLTLMRGFGIPDEDEVACFGINAKLNEIHAAMAMTSLDGLHDLIGRNRERYTEYSRLLAPIGGLTVREFDESEQTSYKNILVRLDHAWPLSRDGTLAVMQAEGALARPYYSPALHTLQTGFETRFDSLPVSERISKEYMLLPCGDQMSLEDIGVVVDLLSFIAQYGAEINTGLERASNLSIHTGYDPVALGRAASRGNP